MLLREVLARSEALSDCACDGPCWSKTMIRSDGPDHRHGFFNAANEARRPAVARCGLMKGTDGVRSAGGSRCRLGDMPATASRRRSARHKTQGAGGLAIEHHRPLPGLRVCPCAWLRCRRSGRLFGIVAVVVVVVAVLIAVGCWVLVTPAPHLRHTCATPAQPLRNPCATPAQPLRNTGSATQQSEGQNRVSAQEGFRMTWSDITFGAGSEMVTSTF